MTRRWLSRTTLTVLPAVVIALSVPSVVLAQPQNPPPPAIPAPPIAEPAPQPAAPVVAERPMRFILTGGTVVIGTRVAEDAEFFTVNTASGLVRVRKSDVASMDYNVTAGTQAPTIAPPQPPPQLPPPSFNYSATRPSRPGRGLLVAGTIMFSISYGLTVFGATIASVENSDAFLLLLPVAGPVVYAAVADEDTGDGSLALFINLTLLQGAGLIMLIVGASKSAAAQREGQAGLPAQFRIGQADLRVDPVVSPRLQGLALSGTF